jgi:hypothetical protein
MKTFADDMASARKKLDDEELCSYILASLDFEYNSLVSSIVARVVPVTLGELYSQMLARFHQVHTLPHEDMVDSRMAEEASTMVSEAEVIHSTSQTTSSLRVSYVSRPIILSSSATSALTQHTWVRRSWQTLHNLMELTPIGMPTLVQQIM